MRRQPAIPPEPTAAGQCWAMDLMHDALADGCSLTLFTLIDVCSLEGLAFKAAAGCSCATVAQVLADAIWSGPKPRQILVDKGKEFTSSSLDAWAHWNRVKLGSS